MIAILIIIIVGLIFLFVNKKLNEGNRQIYVEKDKTSEEIEKEKVDVLPEPDESEISLETFIKSEIDTKCPFYEPDAETYRQCMTKWLDQLIIDKRINQDSAEYKDLYIQCRVYALDFGEEQYESYGVALSNCLIFRLSQK